MTSKHPKSFAIEAVVAGGVIRIINRRDMLEWASGVGDGIEIVGKLEIAEETRSARASRYYWGVVVKAAEQHSGQPGDDIHDFWCAHFIANETKHLEFFHAMTGEKIEADSEVRRSSRLNRSGFYDYVEQCREWLIEYLGVTTPDPDAEFWRKKKSEAA